MRHALSVALLCAVASVASAQMPPSISKPIDAAKKAANAANANTAAKNQDAVPAPKPAAPAKGAPAKAPTATAASKGGAAVPSASQGGKPADDAGKVTFEREVFTYAPREIDPFASPIETGAIRPLVADLRLVGIIYDATGRNSVAVMRDVSTAELYRVKVGQKLGRARVASIKTQEVVISIEEYGFSRPETLKLNTTQQTQQTKGKP